MTTKTQAILAAAAAFQVASTEMIAASEGRKSAQNALHASQTREQDARQGLHVAEQELAAASMMDADEQEHIAPGDVVRLKSGGPLMTVGEVIGDMTTCSWNNGPTVEHHGFHVATLEKSKA